MKQDSTPITSLFSQTRRRMLLGLAAASTAAAAGTTEATAGQQEQPECPELLAFADQLNGASQAHSEARAKVQRIVAEWEPHWPTPDEKIIRYSSGSKTHRGIDGRGIEMPYGKGGLMKVPDLGTPEVFEENRARHLAEYKRKLKTKSQRGAKYEKAWMEREAAAIEPARAYWSEVERIKRASGIEAAQATKTATLEALRDLVGRIVTHRERTVAGLIIKAQAMQTWSEVDDFQRHYNPYAVKWADEMTATIVRQTASASA